MGYRPGDKVKWRQSYSEKGCSQAWPEICYCPGVKEDQMIFCLREIVSNTDSAGGYSFTEFYVLPRYFSLTANTDKEENGIKKIF
jgi:hypothetical protein